jgi:hypothetical protein
MKADSIFRIASLIQAPYRGRHHDAG